MIPLTEGSVWSVYAKTHEIELLKKDHMTAVTQRKGPGDGLVLVRHTEKEKLDRKKRFAPAPGFQFQLWDDDAAFLDGGSEAYWT